MEQSLHAPNERRISINCLTNNLSQILVLLHRQEGGVEVLDQIDRLLQRLPKVGLQPLEAIFAVDLYFFALFIIPEPREYISSRFHEETHSVVEKE